MMRFFSVFVLIGMCAIGSPLVLGEAEGMDEFIQPAFIELAKDALSSYEEGDQLVFAELVDQLDQTPPVAGGSSTPSTLVVTADLLNQATGCGLEKANQWSDFVRQAHSRRKKRQGPSTDLNSLGNVVSLRVDHINAVTGPAQINTIPRLAAFIAQTAHESGRYNRVQEGLDYRANRLLAKFGTHFKNLEEANQYAHQPQKIANRVYAGRMGNGPESSGDGWRFSGKGLIQLTGRTMYEAASKALGIDLVNHPELVTSPDIAAKTSAWYWNYHNLNQFADNGDFKTMTERINGGLDGLADRQKFLSALTVALKGANLHNLIQHVTDVTNQHLADGPVAPLKPPPPATTCPGVSGTCQLRSVPCASGAWNHGICAGPAACCLVNAAPVKAPAASVQASTCPSGVPGTCQLMSVPCASGLWTHGICPGAPACCLAGVAPVKVPSSSTASTCPGGIMGTCQLRSVPCASGVWKHGICPGAPACCVASTTSSTSGGLQLKSASPTIGSLFNTAQSVTQSVAKGFNSAVVDSLNLAPNAHAAALILVQKFPFIIFTSGRRDIGAQAHAMASNLIHNRKWIGVTYAKNEATHACQQWVDQHPEAVSILELAKGLYDTLTSLPDSARRQISLHLAGHAFDIQPVGGATGQAMMAEIRALPNMSQFLTREGGLTRWHVEFRE